MLILKSDKRNTNFPKFPENQSPPMLQVARRRPALKTGACCLDAVHDRPSAPVTGPPTLKALWRAHYYNANIVECIGNYRPICDVTTQQLGYRYVN